MKCFSVDVCIYSIILGFSDCHDSTRAFLADCHDSTCTFVIVMLILMYACIVLVLM